MKLYLIPLFIFVSSFVFAQVFTTEYTASITKEKALLHMSYYQEDMISYKYTPKKINEISSSQYDIVWTHLDDVGGEMTVRVSYLFSETSLRIEMFEAIFSKDKMIYTIKESDESEVKQRIYKSNKNLYVEVLSKYINQLK